MTTRESMWGRVPGHRVELDPAQGTRRARFRGALVAESDRALVVRETRHEPVVYFPREDVRLDRLERTSHATFCPFKGEACYWTLRVGDAVAENAAWSYEDPFEQVDGLRGHVAFYADRVEVE